jgi:hypothetical protein
MARTKITPLVSDKYIKGVLTGHGSPDENNFCAQAQARYDRLRSCLGKAQHTTQEAAKKASRGMAVYMCRHCDFYHVGHAKEKQK